MTTPSHATIILKPDREKPLLSGHPWIFSGAIDSSDNARDGDNVEIFDSRKEWLGRGYYNSRSQITVRILTRQKEEALDESFFIRRLQQAHQLRLIACLDVSLSTGDTTAFRLVNGEADGLPGLIVDVYDRILVTQFLTLGMTRCRPIITAALDKMFHPRAIFDRSDSDVLSKEGLEPHSGLLCGEIPDGPATIREAGLQFLVDFTAGQKTGYYLDQRENRRSVARLVAGMPGTPALLNAFAYTGGFGVHSAAAHPYATILHLDESSTALDLARRNHELNGTAERAEFQEGNAFHVLRTFRDQRRSFDVIILDPPKFAASQGRVAGACRGYKDLNLLAMKLLNPGGLLATFSCSGLVTPELFRKVVFGAATDARRDVQIIAITGHAPDHPVLLSFPEGEYLKGLILRVL